MPIIVELMRWLCARVIAIGTTAKAAWEVPRHATSVAIAHSPQGSSATRLPMRSRERSTSQSMVPVSWASPNR